MSEFSKLLAVVLFGLFAGLVPQGPVTDVDPTESAAIADPGLPEWESEAFLELGREVSGHAVRFVHTSRTGLVAGFAPGAVVLQVAPGQRTPTLADPVVLSFVDTTGGLPTGRASRGGQLNIFVGSDPAQWRAGIAAYEEVWYEDLYPGIDLVYRVSDGSLKYEYRVAPGADLDQIQMRYDGAQSLRITAAGEVAVDSGFGVIRDTTPSASDTSGRTVACGFQRRGDAAVGFSCEGWDRVRPLIIDPVVFATYLGGVVGASLGEGSTAIATDVAGNTYVTGSTDATDFPVTVGAYDTSYNGGLSDGFIAKFDASGALVYATLFGGTGYDDPFGIAVDSAESAIVTGSTGSSDFPTTAGAFDRSYSGGFRDGFVVRLSPAGDSLSYSTFLGGSGADYPAAVALDASGNAIVCGGTLSTDFPTTPGALDTVFNGASIWGGDIFVATLSSSGSSLLLGTFLGGTDAEWCQSVAVDGGGSMYVSGYSYSADFPATAAAFDTTFNGGSHDAIVAKLNPAGSALTYATFVGGNNWDWGYSIALDGAGNAYVAGETLSANFPTSPGAFDDTLSGARDAFAVKLDPSGSTLEYGTYLGGGANDWGRGVAVDAQGNAFVVGAAGSSDFPTIAGAPDRTADFVDAFLVRLNATGQGLRYGTLLGGTQWEEARAIAVDAAGRAHLTGLTSSTDFPTTAGAPDATLGGPSDAFVATIDVTSVPIGLDTVPGGLQIGLDTTTGTAPIAAWCVPGSSPTVNAPSPQYDSGTRYRFTSWSDAGPQSHAVPCVAASLTATFATEYEVTVDTIPYYREILVEGALYTAPQSFWWPADSLRSIEALSPQVSGPIRYTFDSWSDGGARAHTITVSAPETYTAFFTVEYEITIDTAPGGLAIEVDGVPATARYTTWCADDATLNVSTPSPQGSATVRYFWMSWSDDGAQTHDVPCFGPSTIVATFAAEFSITVDAQPALQIEVNGTAAPSPVTFWCLEGTTRVLGAPSPQTSGPTRYEFDTWSDGGTQTHSITCLDAGTFVASFRAVAHQVTLTTVPASLQITVDAQVHDPPYTFWCTVGVASTIGAPSPQGGPDTRSAFDSWSDSGAQTHDVACTGPQTLTATFVSEHRLQFATDPQDLQVRIEGVTQTAPVEMWCRAGASVEIEVSGSQQLGGTEYVFTSWTDGGGRVHTVLCGGPGSYTARFAAGPDSPSGPPAQPPWTWIVVAAVIAVVLILAVLLLRRRGRKGQAKTETDESKGE